LASVAQRHCGPSVQGRRDPMDYRDGHTAWWSRIGCDRAACQRLEMRDAPPRMLLVPKRRKIAPWFHGGSTPFRVALFYKTLRHNLLILLVPLAGLAFANISKGLDCQTALRGSIGPQRISGAVSNHHRHRRTSRRQTGRTKEMPEPTEPRPESDIRRPSEPVEDDERKHSAKHRSQGQQRPHRRQVR